MSLTGKVILGAIVLIAGKLYSVIEKQTTELFSRALPPLDADFYRYLMGVGIPGYLIAKSNYNYWTHWWNFWPHPLNLGDSED